MIGDRNTFGLGSVDTDQWYDVREQFDGTGNPIHGYPVISYLAGPQAVWNFGDLNGRNTLTLGAFWPFDNTPTLESATAAEMWVVMMRDTGSGDANTWNLGTASDLNNPSTWDAAGVHDDTFSTTFHDFTPTEDITDYCIIRIRSSASEWTCWINQVQQYTTATNTYAYPTSDRYFYLGGCRVAEIAVIARELTADEVTNAYAILEARWFGGDGSPPDRGALLFEDDFEEDA